MKKAILYSLSLFFISTICKSQTVIEVRNDGDSLNKIYNTGIDQEANFPGGTEAWRKYLLKKLKVEVPMKKGAPDGAYKVIVRFIVSIDGTLSDFTAETNFGYGMEDEAIRFIKKGPKWEPAQRYGRKVNAYRRQSITFLVVQQ